MAGHCSDSRFQIGRSVDRVEAAAVHDGQKWQSGHRPFEHHPGEEVIADLHIGKEVDIRYDHDGEERSGDERI